MGNRTRLLVLVALGTVVVAASASGAAGHHARSTGGRLALAGKRLAVRGHQLWFSRYDDPAHGPDGGGAVLASQDGSRVFVFGGSNGDNLLTAYDALTGTQLWVQLPPQGIDTRTPFAVAPDGSKVFVSGSGPDLEYMTTAYDGTSGAELWVAHYHDPCLNFDIPTSLAVSPNGTRLFVTGSEGWFRGARPRPTSPTSACDTRFQTVAYDTTTGTREWVRFQDGRTGENNIGANVAVSPDGTRVFVSGGRGYPGYRDMIPDYATFAYDAQTGAELWKQSSRRWAGPAGNEFDPLVVSPDGMKVFISAHTIRPPYDVEGYVTIAYDAGRGAKLWQRRYERTGVSHWFPLRLAISPDGSKLAVLQTVVAEPASALIAYDTVTGARLWVNHDRLNRCVRAIAFAPDSTRLYLAGRIWFPCENTAARAPRDIFTLADEAASGSPDSLIRYQPPDAFSEGSFTFSPDVTRLYTTGGIDPYPNSDLATIAYQAN